MVIGRWQIRLGSVLVNQ